jgi:WD40 repeat protein
MTMRFELTITRVPKARVASLDNAPRSACNAASPCDTEDPYTSRYHSRCVIHHHTALSFLPWLNTRMLARFAIALLMCSCIASALVSSSLNIVKQPLEGQPQATWAIGMHPNGKTFITSGPDGTLRSWDLTGKLQQTWKVNGLWLNAPIVHPDGKTLYATIERGKDQGQVVALSIVGNAVRQRFRPANSGSVSNYAFDVAIAPNGRQLAVAGNRPGVSVFNLSTGKLEFSLNHREDMNHVRYTDDGKRLLVGGFRDTFVWNLASQSLERRLEGIVHPEPLPDNAGFVAVNGNNGTVVRFTFVDFNASVLKWETPRVAGNLKLSPNGRMLVSGNLDGTVTFWDVLAQRELATEPLFQPSGHLSSSLIHFAFVPDGSRLILGAVAPAALQVWTLRNK